MGQDRTGQDQWPLSPLSHLQRGTPRGHGQGGSVYELRRGTWPETKPVTGLVLDFPASGKNVCPSSRPVRAAGDGGTAQPPSSAARARPRGQRRHPGADVGSRQAHCCGGELGTHRPAAAVGPSLARAGRTLTQQTACGGRASASGPGQAGHSGRPTAPGARARPGVGCGDRVWEQRGGAGATSELRGGGRGPQVPDPPPRPGRLVLPGNGASNAARRGPGPTGCAARTPPEPPPPRALVLGSEWPQAGLLGSDLAERPE